MGDTEVDLAYHAALALLHRDKRARPCYKFKQVSLFLHGWCCCGWTFEAHASEE